MDTLFADIAFPFYNNFQITAKIISSSPDILFIHTLL